MTEPCKDCGDYKLDIALVKKDVSNITRLCEKMDSTIDKMQDVASNLTRIVSLQEQKINSQETINKEVDSKLDNIQKEHNKDIEQLNDRISKVNSELTTKIEQSQSHIVAELVNGRQQLRDEINNVNINLNKKIGEIDMWRYMVMGAIVLGVWLFTNLTGLSKLFH
jgi:protein subunit release factor A